MLTHIARPITIGHKSDSGDQKTVVNKMLVKTFNKNKIINAEWKIKIT